MKHHAVRQLMAIFYLAAGLASISAKPGDPGNKEKILFLQSQIRKTEDILRQLESDKKSFITQIRVRQGLINHRNDLIRDIRIEVGDLALQLESLEQKNRLAIDTFHRLKAAYDEIACQKNRSRFLQPISSGSGEVQWSLLFRKMLWREQYDRARIAQFMAYKKSQEEVLSKQSQILKKLAEKKELLAAEQAEMEKLNKDLAELQDNFSKISGKSKEFVQLIAGYNKEQRVLEEIVNKGIYGDRGSVPFNGRRSKGSWSLPLKDGTVITRFGVFRDRRNAHITLRNNGVDVRSSESFVRAVCASQVVQVRQLPSGSFLLLTSVDGLYVVYSNLDKVFVRQGEQLFQGSNLGELRSSGQGSFDLHFEVWEGKKAVDPVLYLGF